MAVFVDLDEEAEPPNADIGGNPLHPNYRAAVHHQPDQQPLPSHAEGARDDGDANGASTPEPSSARDHFRNGMTEALGCYPIAMAVTASLDLNTLHNLSRTCRAVRLGLLQYRASLVAHTLHCVNEDVEVDPDDTFRYRARAGNWFYMRDDAQGDRYNGKSGNCARDMVDGCRRCGNVVCRNCAIKPPAPIVLRDRHRRLCIACSKAPLGSLAKPPLLPDTPVDADIMKRAMCTCESEGVWLCQPCGRSIRGADHDYQAIWRWRNQYGEILGGVGTGIGDGDRGVICGRDFECIAAKEREHETDCDAADMRELTHSSTPAPRAAAGPSAPSLPLPATNHAAPPAGAGPANLPLFPSTPPSSSSSSNTLVDAGGRTPSPAHSLGPGYARHEIEGIGGVVKTKRLSMVKVGACVPEWEDEKNEGKILRREVQGAARSWCGWCWRVIPGQKDREKTREMVIR